VKLQHILTAVALGILYGYIDPNRLTFAFGQATLYLFLPALLFEAAWNLNIGAMRRQWIAIAILAGPGVLLTATIVGAALHSIGVPFAPALLAGAILSATDPIAVVAVFRRLPVPRTLATIVECEALFNDAIAFVLYRVMLLVVGLGVTSAATAALVTFEALAGAVLGVGIGIAVAFVAAGLLRGAVSPKYQIVATIVCAFGSYVLADYLRCSGIFATIACGIALRRYERAWITLRIAEDVERFWDVTALLANAIVFFMVGAALQLGRLTEAPLFTLACIVGVAIARFAVAGMLIPGPYPRQWLGVVRAAGMRGALCLALALTIPASLSYRGAIIDATFAVTLASIIVSALTIDPVVRRLHASRG
jgi:CPA1 family monovalent cation:H+ antiporter